MIAAIFGLWSLKILYWGHDFGSRALLALATTALSVWVTLFVVKLALKEDRNNQWHDVRVYTYIKILYHLSGIATSFFEIADLINETCLDCPSLDEQGKTILNWFSDPSSDKGTVDNIVNAYMGLSSKLQLTIEKLNGIEDELLLDKVSRQVSIMDRYILTSLKPISLILIPRMLMLSDNKEICEKLVQLDNHQTLYADLKFFHDINAEKRDFEHLVELAGLIKESADIFKAICEDLTPEDIRRWPGQSRAPEDQSWDQETP